MSSKTFNKLSKSHQDAILKAAEEGAKLGRELGIKLDRESLEILVNQYNVKVFDMDVDEIRKSTASVIERNAKKLGLYELVEEVAALR